MNIDRIDGDCRMTNMVTDRKDQLVLYVVMAMAFFLDGLDGTSLIICPHARRHGGRQIKCREV